MENKKKEKPIFNEKIKYLNDFHRQEHLEAQNNPLPKLKKTTKQVYKEVAMFHKEARKVRLKEALEKLHGVDYFSESELDDLYKKIDERWKSEEPFN